MNLANKLTVFRMVLVPFFVVFILTDFTPYNELIALIKETSVVSFVGATDLYIAFNYIGSNHFRFCTP